VQEKKAIAEALVVVNKVGLVFILDKILICDIKLSRTFTIKEGRNKEKSNEVFLAAATSIP